MSGPRFVNFLAAVLAVTAAPSLHAQSGAVVYEGERWTFARLMGLADAIAEPGRPFEDWTAEDSKPLLDYLYQHAQQPQFFCRFRWEEGSIAFWDNYHTWHFAVNDYAAGERVMHRIVVNGPPFSPELAAHA